MSTLVPELTNSGFFPGGTINRATWGLTNHFHIATAGLERLRSALKRGLPFPFGFFLDPGSEKKKKNPEPVVFPPATAHHQQAKAINDRFRLGSMLGNSYPSYPSQ